MKLPVKYIILVFAFIAGFVSFKSSNMATGITAGGAFICYAILEVYDLIIINKENKEL